MSRPTIPSKRPAADAQEAAWIADEDRFVLQQAKKKAAIRIKGGRAQPIDWLAVTLAVIDPDRNPGVQDELVEDGEDLEIVDPESVIEGLNGSELADLERGIDSYLGLESSRKNLEYWKVRLPSAASSICTDADRLWSDDEDNRKGPARTAVIK